ncbi:DNA starvation/stationary phase protection protein Dps [Ahrensia sp. R2A130]|uniref:DNA starvation/stationary phase protection protein Dps n=1 Tax=Ahrensia sp. R2A130 TaxID=744979 RepID=UPI0001E0D0D4|nr:DNA starvation/stationary phase protection protein Dps [Ahrensia sp. R2A130]EFL89762.1 DNA protection during starvation protein [Ahrensia sp. R2A130]
MPEAFVRGLEDNARETCIDLLQKSLADTTDLFLAIKQAHWNLKGAAFIGVHKLLDDEAAKIQDFVDTIAERLVILGGTAHGTSQKVVENSSMEAYPLDIQKWDEHVDALKERYMEIGKHIRARMAEAGEAGDEDTADLFTEVSRGIDKGAWFIGAHTA